MRFVKQIRQLPLNSLSVKVLLAYVVGVVLSTLCIGLVAIALMIAQESDMFSPTNLAEVADGLAGELVFDDQGIPVGMEEEDNDMEDAWFFFDSLNGRLPRDGLLWPNRYIFLRRHGILVLNPRHSRTPARTI